MRVAELYRPATLAARVRAMAPDVPWLGGHPGTAP